MTQSGWRKPTPGLAQAERFARVGEQLSVPKSQALVAVKKVASAIGLKPQDLLLLDTFGAVTQCQDWEGGHRPIVWASNHFLMAQTGFSLTTLRRHVRRLYEAGVISMSDSPNGKRWGRRDEDGSIVEAYGFDLSPLAARTEEFEALYLQIRAEREKCSRLRNAVTVTRRVIRARIEAALQTGLSGPWSHLNTEFSQLLENAPVRSERAAPLEMFLQQARGLLKRVLEAFERGSNKSAETVENGASEQEDDAAAWLEMTPMGAKNGTHILTTSELHPVDGNCFEPKHAADDSAKKATPPTAEAELGVDLDIDWSTHTSTSRSEIDIPTLMTSCPHFAEMARERIGYLRDWSDVHRASATLRPDVGISEDAWNVANRILGPAMAAASVALILDKTADGEVRSPGGYLRGLVDRAQKGELHLERSIYGRLSSHAA